MATGSDRHKRFSLALVTWLRTNATLTGLVTGSTNIFAAPDISVLPAKCVGVMIPNILPMFDDVDVGPYFATVELILRGTSISDVYSMIGCIEDLSAKNETTGAWAKFTGVSLQTDSIKFAGVSTEAKVISGVNALEMRIQLDIVWRETS